MKKLILLPGSLRRDSYNVHLLKVCAEYLKAQDVQTLEVPAGDLNVPLINTDDEHDHFPPSVKDWSDKIISADGVVIATPEYNGSISPIIKNFIDWTSRLSPHPWKKKPVFLCGATPGYFGTIRGLEHSRHPLQVLGAFVYPQPYGLPFADKELLPSATRISDSKRQQGLEGLLTDFIGTLR